MIIIIIWSLSIPFSAENRARPSRTHTLSLSPNNRHNFNENEFQFFKTVREKDRYNNNAGEKAFIRFWLMILIAQFFYVDKPENWVALRLENRNSAMSNYFLFMMAKEWMGNQKKKRNQKVIFEIGVYSSMLIFSFFITIKWFAVSADKFQ